MLKLIEDKFVFFLFLGIGLGVFFPNFFKQFSQFVTVTLMVLMFLSSLKLDYDEFLKQAKRIKFYSAIVVLSMIVIPAIVFIVTKQFLPALALGGMILVSLPSGVNNIVFTDLFKGNTSIALLMTIVTHLIYPLTIPALTWFFVGKELEIDYLGLFLMLLQIILLPLILSYFAKRVFRKQIEKNTQVLKVTSVLLTMFILAAILAPHVDKLFAYQELILLGAVYTLILFLGLILVGLKIGKKYSKADHIALGMSFYHLNLGLGLVMASIYFPLEAFIIILIAEFSMAFYKLVFKQIVEFAS